MSKHSQSSAAVELPPHLKDLLKELPLHVNRRTGAELITKYLFPVSHRSLEAWPVSSRFVNRQAVIETEELFKQAYAKFAAAPLVKGGRAGREKQAA
jgi:hypothetical protein